MNKECLCKIRELYMALDSFDKEFTKRFGLDLTQALALCHLQEEPDKGAGEIAAALGLKASHTSKLIAKMEAKGLIKRKLCKEDLRCMKFSLTPSGAVLLSTNIATDITLPTLLQSNSSAGTY